MAKDTTRRTYTRKDLCRMLGCSDVTLWRRIRDGRIRPPRDIAGLERWTDEDVAELFGEDVEAA